MILVVGDGFLRIEASRHIEFQSSLCEVHSKFPAFKPETAVEADNIEDAPMRLEVGQRDKRVKSVKIVVTAKVRASRQTETLAQSLLDGDGLLKILAHPETETFIFERGVFERSCEVDVFREVHFAFFQVCPEFFRPLRRLFPLPVPLLWK